MGIANIASMNNCLILTLTFFLTCKLKQY